MIVVFIFSYSFIIQPHYDAPEDEIVTDSVTVEVSKDNSYLIKNSDETYTLYIDGIASVSIDEEYADMMEKDGFRVID